jgi:LAS seventeen-binding protein 1/2
MISDEAYEGIHGLLPAESALSGAAAKNRAPAPVKSNPTPPPTSAMSNMRIDANPPPAYNQTGPPALPTRNQPPPSKPVIAQARALYRYTASDARDLSFEKDDTIDVHEYMNADWWMGRNSRTNQEGIFPKTYVLVENAEKGSYNNFAAPQQPTYAGNSSGPPAQQNVYNPHAPPPAEGGAGDNKTAEYGKKFGKKLVSSAHNF